MEYCKTFIYDKRVKSKTNQRMSCHDERSCKIYLSLLALSILINYINVGLVCGKYKSRLA